MTPDEEIAWNRAVWHAWNERAGRPPDALLSSAEMDLVYRWRKRDIPLPVVLRGIQETGGKPRWLHACEAAVERAVQYHAQTQPMLTELPPAMPLDAEFEAEWDAQRVADERAKILDKHGRAR